MVKMVILVRKDLKMNKGKIGSQCAHAALAIFLNRGEVVGRMGGLSLECDVTKEMTEWIEGKFTKVCLAVNSEEELFEVYNAATVAGLPCVMIKDAGDTVFNGVPTNTVVAIGPADADKIDKITGGLKLL